MTDPALDLTSIIRRCVLKTHKIRETGPKKLDSKLFFIALDESFAAIVTVWITVNKFQHVSELVRGTVLVILIKSAHAQITFIHRAIEQVPHLCKLVSTAINRHFVHEYRFRLNLSSFRPHSGSKSAFLKAAAPIPTGRDCLVGVET